MGEFIYMLSACGNDDSRLQALENSMLRVATQTLSRDSELRKKVGTMQQRMEMWSVEDLKDRAETAWINLALSGARLQLRNLQQTFGTLLDKWTHVRFAAISPPYRNLWSGSTGPTLPTMQHRQEYNSTWLDHQDCLTGVEQTLMFL